jgi:hypothetical protein
MSKILNEIQTNPSTTQPHMHSLDVLAKIEKLIAAGVLQVV